ncbi:PREDICTED: phospholipase DDHD1-like isoform X1 [Amphimedon queenslandica]|uniref:DDHD domain-containing protein n=1 Tax=Amphimedon queenslandica TaxID=400682 RepID=A0A1X7VR06_AMPQE|nr:PREDICTED: phospholipase DDHD1-like isoform X1 [Amphimedon queenslandica]|eukprot:XP_019858671.1 PREDICTED: phospholipase DDHD1-like isoform X1 [Amphimedon queenslandica]
MASSSSPSVSSRSYSSKSLGGKPERPPPPRHSASVPSYPSTGILPNVPPLPPERLRWFYMENGKIWRPFCGHDSLNLEEARTILLQEAVACPDVEREVEVMGNMYIVVLHSKESPTLKPIYWEAKPCPVLRGSWFEVISSERWLPLSQEEADLLEEAHTRKDWRERARADASLTDWANSNKSPDANNERRGSAPLKSQSQNTVVLNQVSCNGYEAVWTGENDIVKIKTDLTSKLLNKVGGKVGISQQYGATKLTRGYKEACLPTRTSPPIGHLVFVIHGIGQNMDASDIVKSTSDLRDTCRQTALKHFPDQWKNKRVEFIPIEWRTWLTLDQGAVASITPHGVKALRSILNDSVLDIMFYVSPRFGPEILDGLRWQLHKKYDEFIRRNPDFISNNGTVSMFAHSLGSVMCYDLMYETCHINGLLERKERDCTPMEVDLTDHPFKNESDEKFEELQKLRIRVAELESELGIKKDFNSLKFKVDHLFAVGSPLGIFLMLREHSPLVKGSKGADSLLPSAICKRIHNVHHPSDPVAYRLEPLISPVYAQVKPVKMDTASSKPTQKSMSLAEGPKTPETTQSTKSSSSSSWTQSLISAVVKSVASSNGAETSKSLPPDKIFDDDTKIPPGDRLNERLDFMLREGLTENSYLNSITAHTGYWTNSDCAMYLLLQLYSYKKDSKL